MLRVRKRVRRQIQEELGLTDDLIAWLSDHKKGPYAGTITQKLFDEVVRGRANGAGSMATWLRGFVIGTMVGVVLGLIVQHYHLFPL